MTIVLFDIFWKGISVGKFLFSELMTNYKFSAITQDKIS